MAEPFNQTGDYGTTVSFDAPPASVEAASSASFDFTVIVGERGTGDDLDVEIKAFLYVAGEKEDSIVASTSTVATENDVVSGSLSHVFEPNATLSDGDDAESRIVSPIWVKVELEYFGAPGYSRGRIPDESASTTNEEIRVTPIKDEPVFREFGEEDGRDVPTTISDTFANRTPFSIQGIEFEDDANYVSSVFRETERSGREYQITFEYPNPTVSIDTAGRFAKHEIIGGSTVRQKIGEDPVNVSINGVCKRRTANQIDSLRDAKHGNIISDRLPGSNDSLRVQFGSTSTEPMTDGGSADLRDGKYLYTFQINAIEVIR